MGKNQSNGKLVKASEQKAKIRYALRKVSLTTVWTAAWRSRETRRLCGRNPPHRRSW